MKGTLHFACLFILPRIDDLMFSTNTSLYTLQLEAKETYSQKGEAT